MFKKVHVFFCLFLLFFVKTVDGHTSHIITQDKTYLNGLDAAYQDVKPGDTLVFAAGAKIYLLIKNFHGTKDQPIVMINSGGPVIIDTDHYFGISIQNCQYFKFSGTGDPTQTYGFQVKRVANGSGMGIGYLSSDFEIDHVSIENCMIGGLYAKTDPDCTLTSVRSNFTQYNTIIHDNYIANAGNEGMYIGSTKYDGQTIRCNGKDTVLMPSLLEGVRVYNNIVKNAGWDGIQVSSASKDCKIYNNTVLYDSQLAVKDQMSGIIIGGGTMCDCFNNFISQGKGDGIESHGLGGTRIFNNIILDAGRSFFPADPAQRRYGIYISDNNSSVYIANNNIINPKSDGIRFAAVSGNVNIVASNVIVNPGNFDLYQNGNAWAKGIDSYVMRPVPGFILTLQNNYFARNIDSVKFASSSFQSPDDFKLLVGSPLIDKAEIDDNINFDFVGLPRPFGNKSDIGAFEFRTLPAVKPIAQEVTGGGPFCEGDQGVEVGLAGSQTGIRYELILNGTNTGKLITGTGTSVSFGLQTSAGTYTATGTDTISLASNPMAGSVSIQINALPTPDPIIGIKSICLGSTTTLTDAVAGGVWKSLSPLIASVSTTGDVTGLTTGTATILYTVTNESGCSDSIGTSITVNPLPVVFTVNGGGSFCSGGTGVAIGLNGSQSGINYQLILNGTLTGRAVVGTGSAISFGLQTASGTYTIIGTDQVTGCNINMTGNAVIHINPLPSTPAPIGNRSMCLGSTITLTNATTGGVWSSLTPSVATISTTGVVKGISTGTTVIQYTLTNGSGCKTSTSANVTVDKPVSQPGKFTTSTTKVIQGRSNVAYIVPFVSGVTYQWRYTGTGATIAGTGNSVLVGFSRTATSGTLNVTVFNGCGTSSPRSIAISVSKLKGANLSLDSAFFSANGTQESLFEIAPVKSSLSVYPNPSLGATTFNLQIDKNAHVTLEIFTLSGKLAARVCDADLDAGVPYKVFFQQPLASGIYTCVMRWGDNQIIKKLMVKQ